MRLLHDLPIKRKLTLISMLTSTVVLLLAGAAFLGYEQLIFRESMERDVAVTAQMIGLNSAAALSFDDREAAEQTLSALHVHPHVLGARIYDERGEPFASYLQDPETQVSWPTRIGEGADFEDRRLALFRPIEFAGERIGTIYLQSDLRELYARLARFAAIAGSVLVLSTFIAFLISSRLQRVISEPILQLAKTAARVGEGKDYSLRATKQGNDELGYLIDGFNNMLAQIQERDADLQQAHNDLEKRVEERTAAMKEAREEAERDKARFKFIFNAVPVGISWRVPYEDDTHLVNPAHERITGISAAESLLPGAFDSVTHPEDRERQVRLVQRFVDGEIDHYSMEKRYLHPGGGVVWAIITSRMFTDPSGGEPQSVTTLVDITEVKRAQEEAAREHARFKFIFESVPVGISWVVPGDRSTHLSNPAHSRITGVPSESTSQSDAFKRVSHPDDYRRQVELTKQLVAGEIEQFSLEKRYLHPGGKIVWAALTRRMYADPATGARQSVTTLVDITDRKRSMEELDRIFTLSQDMICTVGFDGYFRRINPAFERTLGYSSEELLGHPFLYFMDPADREIAIKEQARLTASGKTTSLENRYICKDGSTKWLQWKAVAIQEEQLYYCVVRDITEQKQGAVELEQMHKQLLDASRQAGMAEVATGVLHNVGNVLNSINVSATVVADRIRQSKAANVSRVSALLRDHASDLAGFLSTDQRGRQVPGYLDTLGQHLAGEQQGLLEELDQLSKNLEHVKDIVAMQQNYAKLSGVAETFSAVDLIEDALRMNAGALTRHDVSVIRDYRSLPKTKVEKHKVLQILVNLIRNAKYACDESGRTNKEITVRVSQENGAVQIAIIDNGVGIPAENLTRIFTHGFTTRKEGHGFGLHSGAIAAGEIGGALNAYSDGDGKGATFVLELPVTGEGSDS